MKYDYSNNVLIVNEKPVCFVLSINRVVEFSNVLVVQVRAKDAVEFEAQRSELLKMDGGLVYGVDSCAEIIWQVPYKHAAFVNCRTDDWFRQEYANRDVVEIHDGSMMRYHIDVNTGEVLAEIHGRV